MSNPDRAIVVQQWWHRGHFYRLVETPTEMILEVLSQDALGGDKWDRGWSSSDGPWCIADILAAGLASASRHMERLEADRDNTPTAILGIRMAAQ